MTLAELGMAFWHDLAAPVIAGILASMIVNWLNSGSNVSCGRQAAVMQFAPGPAAGVKLCGLFRKKNATGKRIIFCGMRSTE
ncbi:small toxic polypeptide ldrD [Escherichia coli O104:H4 str. C236-11]|nr:small toxic polypeptide ldrD [Escherichia coli O104:H4 str. C236-11]